MFTGIIEKLGKVLLLEKKSDSLLLIEIEELTLPSTVSLGDSIAVNGVCLTVIALTSTSFSFEVVEETLKKTALSQLKVGSFVNLERALAFQGRLNGHFVQGHVDGLATLMAKNTREGSYHLTFSLPSTLSFYLLEKGSVALNGVSLTLWDVKENTFSVTLIPFTKEHTTLGMLEEGDKAHIEIDMLAKMAAQFHMRQKNVCIQ